MINLTNPQPKWMTWTGRVLSAIPCLALLASAAMKFKHAPEMVDMFVNKFGYFESALPVLGGVELACMLLYALPPTAPLGAILLTGYLGGAVATHVRVADNFAPPLILGIMLWVGLVLRDVRLRRLMGFTK